MARLIRASAKTSTTVVLDLEDALWDVGDQARTSALKAAGRENLAILATQHRDLFDRLPIGVRVNRRSGPEGGRDLLALGRACRFVQLDCIVLPLRRRGSAPHCSDMPCSTSHTVASSDTLRML